MTSATERCSALHSNIEVVGRLI